MKKISILARRYRWATLSALAAFLLVSCAVSPETQAKMNEYSRTIPTCLSDAECNRKWAVARNWTLENSEFTIRSESETRINATSNIISQSGVGVVVTKVATSSNGFQIIVDPECFSAYACPDIWNLKIDFNQTVNGAPE